MSQQNTELRQQLAKELENIEQVIQRTQDAWQLFGKSSNHLFLDTVALNLHSFYNGVEKNFQETAKALDETLPQGPGWHQALLQQMAVEKSGIRPAVISQSSREALEEYRAFRHIVRNIYPFRLDVTRIQPLVEEAPNVFFQVRSDLLEFATFLSGADAPE